MIKLNKFKIIVIVLVLVFLSIFGISAIFILPNRTESNTQTVGLNFKEKMLGTKISNVLNNLVTTDNQIIITISEEKTQVPAQTVKQGQNNIFNLTVESNYFIENGEYKTEFLKKVLAHELMHTISLQNKQFIYQNSDSFNPINRDIYDAEEARCKPNYFTTEGCLKDDSYISSFYKKFWTGDLKTEYDEIQTINDKAKFSEELENWGNKYKDSFVSKNASINTEEDLAESFSIWILNYDTSQLSEVQKQKVEFFNDYPELKPIKKNYESNFNKNF